MMNTLRQIPLSQLKPSPENVRIVAAGKQAHNELIASIQAHGLLYPLQVKTDKNDSYLIIDGCRRFEALAELKIETAPCLVLEKDFSSREISLTSNIIRSAMHPADQFVSFRQLIEEGLTEEEISQRFGVSRKTVKQRLKLGRLAPEIIQAYRNNETDLETCMAFALTDDHERQRTIIEGHGGSLKGIHKTTVKKALTEDSLPCTSKIGQFIAKDYIKAGHPVTYDLFANEKNGDNIYLKDVPTAQAMAGEKLQKEADRLVEEENWKWAKAEPEFSYSELQQYTYLEKEPGEPTTSEAKELETIEIRLAEFEESHTSEDYKDIEALNARMDDIYQEIESRRVWSPEIKQKGGCIVTIDYKGQFEIIEGIILKKDILAEKQKLQKSDESHGSSKSEYSESLLRDLREIRTRIIKEQLTNNPDIALDLLLYSLLVEENRFESHQSNPTSLSTGRIGYINQSGQSPQTFEEIEALSPENRHDLLAECIAACLQNQLACDYHANPVFERITERLNINFADHYRPDAEFWSRLTKTQILHTGKELLGNHWHKSATKLTKSALVKEMATLFTQNDHPGMAQDTLDKLSQWVPDGFTPGNSSNNQEAQSSKTNLSEADHPKEDETEATEIPAEDEGYESIVAHNPQTGVTTTIMQVKRIEIDDPESVTVEDEETPPTKEASQTEELSPSDHPKEDDPQIPEIPEFLRRIQ